MHDEARHAGDFSGLRIDFVAEPRALALFVFELRFVRPDEVLSGRFGNDGEFRIGKFEILLLRMLRHRRRQGF